MQDITLPTGAKIIELGGGANPQFRPNVDTRACYDAQGNQTVDFTADFNEPLPISDNEWDGVFARFVIEHLSWRKVPTFLAEVLRILKPGGKVVIITANTEAQLKWLANHPEGWDNKPFFDSASCVLFGDQDYPENAHKNYMTPTVITSLLVMTGFENVLVQPYGERATDMMVTADKPVPKSEGQEATSQAVESQKQVEERMPVTEMSTSQPVSYSPESLFDKVYFNGGGKVGGYAREGMWDFPVHEITARHILARNPKSALELGCARGYILKRLQDAGVTAVGLEVSKHCYLTRVASNVIRGSLCQPWPLRNAKDGFTEGHNHPDQYDLCYSIATLEHIPEQFVPHVIREMARTCQRGLHGIDFGGHDDGFDKTHFTLKPRAWWKEQFDKYAPDWPVEIVDKEDLERGLFPAEVMQGDGKIKLNCGSFTTMYHHGWINLDQHDLGGYAQANGYRYQRHNILTGLPFPTQTVDLIMAHHFLEHLSYTDGLQFLRECRRVLKPSGAMRIVVPSACRLINRYENDPENLAEYDEINDECAAAKTAAGKLWALLHNGHSAGYDEETLAYYLEEAGFEPEPSHHREQSELPHPAIAQILRETCEMDFGLSLFMNAFPKVV